MFNIASDGKVPGVAQPQQTLKPAAPRRSASLELVVRIFPEQTRPTLGERIRETSA
jgi:hypothetical protein